VTGADAVTVRLFVALLVPGHVRTLTLAAAAPARDATPGLAWTRPEGWHVTLAFLGDVSVADVADVERSVSAAVGGGPIGLRLGGAGRFGRHALWLAVDDDPAGAVASLGERIQAALTAADLPVAPRRVEPHLTLARASRRGGRIDATVVAAVAPVDARWEADDVALVRSARGAGTARYETVRSWPLRSPEE
jgi:2'-5' RNA ligase